MKIPLLCAFVVLLCYSQTLYAAMPVGRQGSSVKVQQFINHKDWSFVENKGQLANQSEIKYYGHQGGVYLYCKPGMISFVFTKVDKENDENISEATSQPVSDVGVQNSEPLHRKLPSDRTSLSALRTSISTSRTDLVLLNSNPNAQILATDQQEYYENFYTTGDADHGITNVHTYKTVTYKDIYHHIDMVLNCKEQGMEYSFIVHPGGKVNDIQLQWNGIEATKALANACLSDRQGGFKFSNSLGTLEESAPKSFAEGKVVASSFVGNGFKVGRYDAGKDLVIDPTLSWASYFGGSSDDAALGVSTDTLGNVYIAGLTESSNGLATSGAYQTSFNPSGSGDAFLAKFSSTGNLLWATYYEYGVQAISTDGSGNVYICGWTDSDSGIATSSAYQTSFGGGSDDAFLAKFSSAGNLSWATYFGGSGQDGADEISTDAFGNVYITGVTSSNSGIATSGVYQTSLGFGGDAFLAKFSNIGNLSWATYIGGSGSNSMDGGVGTDAVGNIYVTGYTEYSSGIATSGAYQTSFAGNGDAFLIKFTSSGARLWATYFGGNGEDGGNGITVDCLGNSYMTGYTQSSSGIATVGAYQTSYGGQIYNSYDAFLAKFSSSGSLSWATYYGGTGDNKTTGICTDGSQNVYLTGLTNSTSGIATSAAYQTFYAAGTNGYNAFLAKFSSSGNFDYGTYFGGNELNYGYGISSDLAGNVYIAGSTMSESGIATSGAYQTSFGGIGVGRGGFFGDAFLAKFNRTSSGISKIVNADLYGLAIYPNPFTDKILINFTLLQNAQVKIDIMDIKGNVIHALANKIFNSGANEVEINALKTGLAAGTYFVNIVIDGKETNRKIINMR